MFVRIFVFFFRCDHIRGCITKFKSTDAGMTFEGSISKIKNIIGTKRPIKTDLRKI